MTKQDFSLKFEDGSFHKEIEICECGHEHKRGGNHVFKTCYNWSFIATRYNQGIICPCKKFKPQSQDASTRKNEENNSKKL
ncbi:MAG: hypothetical protein WD876_03160, partial [Candidatus Pacearchaeota archaeon]